MHVFDSYSPCIWYMNMAILYTGILYMAILYTGISPKCAVCVPLQEETHKLLPTLYKCLCVAKVMFA